MLRCLRCPDKGLGFRVWGLGFGVWGLGFGVWGLGSQGLGFWVQGIGVVWVVGFIGTFLWALLGVPALSPLKVGCFKKEFYKGCKSISSSTPNNSPPPSPL